MENFWGGVIASLLAGILFLLLYEVLIKNAFYYFKFSKFRGRFIHCNTKVEPIIKGGHACYVDISLSFWHPNVLINRAFDFGKEPKNWNGKITIDLLSSEHGRGYFRYEKQPFTGTHEIFIVNKNIFYVSIGYYGEKSDSPDLQIWCRKGYEKNAKKIISDLN